MTLTTPPSEVEYTPSELRAWALEVLPFCWWPGCNSDTGEWIIDRHELAHIISRGMGHKGDRNIRRNVVILCKRHHMHYDERTTIRKAERLGLIKYTTAPSDACAWPDCVDKPDDDLHFEPERPFCLEHGRAVDRYLKKGSMAGFKFSELIQVVHERRLGEVGATY